MTQLQLKAGGVSLRKNVGGPFRYGNIFDCIISSRQIRFCWAKVNNTGVGVFAVCAGDVRTQQLCNALKLGED